MRQLTTQEIQGIAGGTLAGVIVGTAVVSSAIALTMLYPAPAGYVVQDYCTSYDVVTPVYDSYGYYQGDFIDTYTTCTPVVTDYYYYW